MENMRCGRFTPIPPHLHPPPTKEKIDLGNIITNILFITNRRNTDVLFQIWECKFHPNIYYGIFLERCAVTMACCSSKVTDGMMVVISNVSMMTGYYRCNQR
jgi:hypothetical protein